MGTNMVDATLTFTVHGASTFFLWGTVNYNHLSKKAIITGEDGHSKETSLEDISEFVDFQQIIYWESGLDPRNNYTVQIVNVRVAP